MPSSSILRFSRAAWPALLLASGQAAETFAILEHRRRRATIVSSPRLYGGTYNLPTTLPKLRPHRENPMI